MVVRLARTAYWLIAYSRRRASQECSTGVVVLPTHLIATHFRFGLSGGIKNGAHTFQNKMPVWNMCDTRTDTCTHASALSLARAPELSISLSNYLSRSLSLDLSRALSPFSLISLSLLSIISPSISLALYFYLSLFLSQTHTHTKHAHTHGDGLFKHFSRRATIIM